jgi:hypothetical protein
MRVPTKQIFHCQVCGRILHLSNEQIPQICCGLAMHLAVKEYAEPVNQTLVGQQQFSSADDINATSQRPLLANRFQA